MSFWSAIAQDAAFHSSMAPSNIDTLAASTAPVKANPALSNIYRNHVAPLIGDSSVNTGNYYPPSSPQPIDYFDAPLAERYGMSAETAYQEALSNSSYQRKVADLKKAGLNPVLGVQGSGAAVFSGDSLNSGSGAARTSGSRSSNSDLIKALPYLVGGFVGLIASPSKASSASSFVKGLSMLK